jgi:hypothetical protein
MPWCGNFMSKEGLVRNRPRSRRQVCARRSTCVFNMRIQCLEEHGSNCRRTGIATAGRPPEQSRPISDRRPATTPPTSPGDNYANAATAGFLIRIVAALSSRSPRYTPVRSDGGGRRCKPTILSPLSYPVILTAAPAIFLFGLIWKRSDVLAR